MGKRHNSLQIVATPGQKFACRDCPARCCTAPWAYPVTETERARILGDDEASARMGERGRAILRAGVLPTRDTGKGRLACVFLDDDLLCSLHKRHGHDFLPGPCQAFPFGFARNERNQIVAQMSRYCPSIRENYGEPVGPLLFAKYQQAGGTSDLAAKMGLRSGRVLPRQQYVHLVDAWKDALERTDCVPRTLSELFFFTDRIDQRLPRDRRPTDQEFAGLLQTAELAEAPPLTPARRGFSVRVLIAHLLGSLCLPVRQMLAHRLTPIRASEKFAAWWVRIRWLLRWGQVDLLFVERPVRLSRIDAVAPIFGGSTGALVATYLQEVLARRQGMAGQTYLHRVLVDLGLMTVLISQYARASASAQGLRVAADSHVNEAISIAELLFTHQGDAGQGLVLSQLRLKLMGDPVAYQRLLASEL